MDDAKVELDQCFSMRRDELLDGVEIVNFVGVVRRIGIGNLMEEKTVAHFPEGPSPRRAFPFGIVVKS